MSTEYLLKHIDQCGLARVRRTLEPYNIFLGIFPLEQYFVEGLDTLGVKRSGDELLGVILFVNRIFGEVALQALLECI